MIQTPIQKLEFPNDRGVRLYCKRVGSSLKRLSMHIKMV